jgi:hypothetical protein
VLLRSANLLAAAQERDAHARAANLDPPMETPVTTRTAANGFRSAERFAVKFPILTSASSGV